jgi:solute carrier family 25 iron transporter 28/37
MNPFDGMSCLVSQYPVTDSLVIKQRMQMQNSPYRTVLSCARQVYAKEGLAAFYVSYPTTLAMSVPFTAVQFTCYESMKGFLNPERTYSPITHVVAGGVAGAVAAAVTTPLDVAKVRYSGCSREEFSVIVTDVT